MRADLRLVNGAIRLDLVARSEHERTLLGEFLSGISGGARPQEGKFLEVPIRIESAGFTGDGSVNSIAVEGPRR